MKKYIPLLMAIACTPLPKTAPPDPTAHCAESCRQLQELECKDGTDEVCAAFDEETGECVDENKPCVEACHDDPQAYPEGDITACP